MRRSWFRVGLFVVVALGLCSMLAFGAGQPEQKDTFKIGFSVKTLTNEPFQAFISQGIRDKVEALGYEFVLMTTNTSADIAQQVSQIEDLINMGCDGIIINPIDSNAVAPVMRQAADRGIPLVFVDTNPPQGTDDLYIAYIGTDNFEASRIAGERMVESLNGAGKVVIVRGADGNVVGNARADGFKAGLAGSGVVVVAEQTGKWTNDAAMQAMENMLQAHPDIDGVYSCSDVMLDGTLQAIANNPNVNKDDVVIWSFDGLKIGIEHLLAGDIEGTIQQNPAVMGDMAVEILDDVLNGRTSASDYDKVIDSGATVVTIENAEKAMQNAP